MSFRENGKASSASMTLVHNVIPSVRLKVPTRRLSLPTRTRLTTVQPDPLAEPNNNKQKHLWLISDYSSHSIRRGRCARLPISVENLRLLILSIALLLYTSVGATIMVAFESSNNRTSTKRLKLDAFLELHPTVSRDDAIALIVENRGNFQDKFFDYDVAFRFIASTLSTVGYGTTTPNTTLGRLLLTVFGFFGCSACILFFNLFLERVVTLFANVLRKAHDQLVHVTEASSFSAGAAGSAGAKERAPSIKVWNSDVSDSETIYSEEEWSPSGFLVFNCIMLFTLAFSLLCAILYHVVEKWSYSDAFYFCFVSFATIGFGDFVPDLESAKGWKTAYMLLNFTILILGCSLLYSLFNITSLLIRQLINLGIRRCNNWNRRRSGGGNAPRMPPESPKLRASAKVRQKFRFLTNRLHRRKRYGSVESVVSLKDFLALNHASLLNIQRQLFALSEPKDDEDDHVNDDFKLSKIGPLAFLNEQFDDEVRK